MTNEQLYRTYYKVFLRLAMTKVKDQRDAGEAVNDAFMKIFDNLKSFKAAKGDFFNWMYTIVKNTALDMNRRRPIIFVYSDGMYNGEIFDTRMTYWETSNSLSVLKPKVRKVMHLHYLDGYMLKEISSILNIPIGTSKYYLNRGRCELRKTLINGPVI